MQQALARLAVAFLARSEFDDPRVAFSARTPAGTLFVTHNGQLVYSLHGGDGKPRARGAAAGGVPGADCVAGHRRRAAAGGGGDAFVAALTVRLLAVDAPAIEYRHAAWNHYFVTADPGEIAKLDASVFAGWARTGESFRVLPLDTAGAANVCRFFSVSFAPKSSHFYTPSVIECAKVKQNPDWQFEAEVFAVWLPDGDDNCGFRRLPLYRLYNDGQGAAPNHRYTTRDATRTEMIAQGWIPEGQGPLGVVACVPM